MNGLDEARYGRACLLVLNICAFTLRQVIEDYYGRQGSLSLQDFLIRNKHNLFHLLRKQCCCQHPHNASTPMNKGQWDILYMSTRTSCSKSQRGDCPCLYDVKPNITTDDMDVTLCCLVLHNLCPGINMADVKSVREVRNKLMHADTAELDEPTYRQYWTNVKTSVLNLARSVSVRLHTATLDKIQKLEQQLMNSADLGELRKLIIDQKKLQELETDVALATQTMSVMQDTANETTQAVAQNAQKITQVADMATETKQEVKQVDQKVLHVEEKVTEIEERMNQTVHDIIPAPKDMPKPKKNIDVSRLKQRLIQVNNDITKVIPLSPLRERGENELPIELLFAEVVIIEDPKYREKGLSLPRQGKNVTDPDDIFKMHDEEVRQVYMLGDAAHGKTTFCIWLIKNWCNAQNAYPGREEKVDKWERALNEFDFVFLLQFRHINPKRTSVIEMICKDLFGSEQELVATIRHVLSSDQYRSLIIMDGLDEWNPNEKARKQLTCQGMPNIENVSSKVSCLFSMRPWVFSLILKNVKISDMVIEIYGLSRDGIKNVVENVLINHCKLKDDLAKSTKKEIMKHLNEKNILSFMKIPLLAVVCVQLWCKCKQVADSMTSFYAAMLNMLIERANEKHKLLIYNRKSVDCRLPEILSDHENIKNCVSLLLKLGKVAYEGILSKETNLVFEKRKLERQVGEADLQFALEIGLISQKEAILRDDKQNVSKLKERLLQINTDLTKVITLSPLQERGEDELPIELLYAQVVICEEYLEKGVKSSGKRKEITEPTDLFMKNGEIVRKIYMLGDAAHGKTTYCIWLLKNWCNAQYEDGEGRSKWETALQEFDFVFLLQFRYVNPSRASVIDMICQDIFGSDKGSSSTIRHVLSSDQYRSLIIMDGLDEWNPSKKTRKRLTCQMMPNIQGISSNVSCFFSMRPWVFSEISKVVKISDRVIEILGLSETGMENVIKNVLLNHYNLKEDLTTLTSTFEKIEKHLKKTNLKSFMQIPLLAVVCVQIWYEEKQIEDSMTGFYAEMLNMMIERAGEKHGHQIKQWRTSCCNAQVPGVLSGKRHVVKHFPILLKLGKVAYEGLVSNERNLELEKSKLEEEIGVNEIQFVLDVGLISQKDARSLLTKRVHVHFFHKSVQEFMAAMYISSEEGIRDSFCNHLSSVNEILDLSNVILFMYGMCPSICNVISQHVVNVADNDADICEYRQAPGINNEVKQLYISQVSWYRELQYRQVSDPVTFYVSDVLLMYSGGEMVRTTKKLLSDHHVCIRSLYIWVVPTKGTAGISNSDLCNFLNSTHKTRSLTMISIQSDHDDRYVNPIRIPSLKILYLQDLEIKDIQLDHHGCRPLLENSPLLSTLVLRNVHLGKRILGLSSDMTLLRNIQLVRVTMTEAAWKVFISSIKNLHHTFDINLTNTNIDEESKKQICSSTDFTIKNAEKRKGFRNLKPIPVPSSYLYFTRVWPLSRDDDNDDVEVLYSRSGLSKSKT
ncbi:hypothetical protein FSP39_020607 [Pinctada imbricata]|uniref:NACHT domain-containing protein n=1 Tax=Pinctada imbricata TaxID=66713 RepID=A0AA88XGG5_PINIB|nr:hypothetical protein FSP39_020607 [Pinctada imbricata]